MAGLLLIFLGSYFGLFVLLYTAQRALVFPAPTVERAVLDAWADKSGAVPVTVPTADGLNLYGWHRKAGGDKLVLYFHGNGATVVQPDLHDFLVEQGFDVLTIAYRGYPGSDVATPSEVGLQADAQAVWRYAVEELSIDERRIVLHGKSLGGGVAALLAEEVKPVALVMESTFTSVPDVAAQRWWMYPVHMLVHDPFRTDLRAPAIDCPVLVVHGVGDPVIHVEHGRKLGQLFPNVTYVELNNPNHGLALPVHEAAARAAYLELLGGV